jgi:MFS family permease
MAVGIALLGLGPIVVLQTAFLPLQEAVVSDLDSSTTAVQVATGLANAAFAVGAVVGAQLGQRFVQRRLFLGYQALFVAGSLVAAVSPDVAVFGVGRVVQGLAAGAMLVASLPPLVTRFGAGRLPLTAAVVNLGIFGTSTLGPIVGQLAAAGGSWRLLLLAAAVVGAVGWVVAHVGYPVFDPADPDAPVDGWAVGLTVVATTATFLATSLLAGATPTDPVVVLPLVVGVAALVALVAVEARRRSPLMPVRSLSTQLPVTGTVVAAVGGAVFVCDVELVQTYLADVVEQEPASIAGLLWPAPLGVLVAAGLFGALLKTRYVPVLVDGGLLALVAASAVLLGLGPDGWTPVVLVAAALLGLGAGATVSPGLFMVGFGTPSVQLGRAFALVQLVRSTVTYAVGPVVLYLVSTSADPASGVRTGLEVVLGLAVVGLLLAVLLPALSGARLWKPDVETWLDGGQALPSPATGTHVRPGPADEVAAPLVPRPRRRRTY